MALAAGMVPVLHGDAVFDDVQGCTILSGDIVVEKLAISLRPQHVAFLTDVPGIFDRCPKIPGAKVGTLAAPALYVVLPLVSPPPAPDVVHH